MKVPATLNGYPVVQHAAHKTCATVIVLISDNNYTPYVVATWWPALSGWEWGHYEQHQADAEATFRTVSLRNARRS